MKIESLYSIQKVYDRISEISSLTRSFETQITKQISEDSKPEFLKELDKARETLELNEVATQPKKILSNAEKWNKSEPKIAFESIIKENAEKQGLDPDLVKAVIKTESNFNPKAISKAGAQGLMQLMPKTAEILGVEDSFDPEQNIAGGTTYLKDMLDMFKDNKDLAIAAYNAGPTAVKKHNGVPPYSETQNYVKKVKANYIDFKR